ncbi:MAG: glycoside hydrolase family 3 N-terminal domain-containing protein [Bacteroidota bacterium]|nr:glycoside hydrolase family 3 N-terminal domain-containing protein [Bacteroidota bacterium]
MKRKFITLFVCFAISTIIGYSQSTSVRNIDQKADSVLKLMTLDEKIGQLNQLSIEFATGGDQVKSNLSLEEQVKKGMIGSFLNTQNMDYKIKLQKIAITQSRMKIPLIFALDVIHGYKVVFPIPLAEACSWDLAEIENAERVAAEMASAHGIHWTFAPMMDVGRDPRWGRVMEGAGEDTWLGAKIAAARVRGFQGEDLSKPNTILACAKHFAAYGFSESGREYNTVEMSERQLREFVLPPFKAASDAGIGTFMNSFNTISAVPASGNKRLVKDILKDEWGFKGFVVSDWESISEMINHGVAADSMQAAALAMNNQSSDMDMVSQVYIKSLKKLVTQGKVKEGHINDACKRILKIKFALGLFDDPLRYFDQKRKEASLKNPAYLEASRNMAKKSMVLLKNDGNVLPLKKDIKSVAIIGPFADGKRDRDYMSFWTFGAEQKDVVTLYQGIKNKLGTNSNIIVDSACGWMGNCSPEGIKRAVDQASKADYIILALGENGERNGECRSRTNIDLPGNQKELIKEILKLNKPTVAVLFNGRPLTLEWESKNIPAILEAWQPGSQAGNAVADVLFGDYNPSGKLTMSFPMNVGQIPVYYNQLPTGRPATKPMDMWKSSYSDAPNEPLYPFGYGLSYTNFNYSQVTLNKKEITNNETLEATITISNTGKYDGEETVQLYIRDLTADVSRPVKELRGFQKVMIKKGESKQITFKLTIEDLKYWNADLVYKADPGKFKLMIGPSSKTNQEIEFELK